MLVAPMLAIIGWFAVDYFVAERPHAAKPGASYPLVARPNCRRAGGHCDLVNEDFEVLLSVRQTDGLSDGFEIELISVLALQQAAVGVSHPDSKVPVVLLPVDDDRKSWRGRIERPVSADDKLRVAVVAAGSTYYAEVPVTFFIISPA